MIPPVQSQTDIPWFPNEIISEILSYAEPGALRSAAHAHSSMLEQSQKRLFSAVVIGGELSAVPEHKFVNGSAEGLTTILAKNPHLAGYISTLIIQSQSLLSDVFLPTLFGQIHHLTELNICQRHDNSRLQSLSWDFFHTWVQEGLIDLARVSPLRTLKLANVRWIDYRFFDQLHGLESLLLENCSFYDDPSEPFQPERSDIKSNLRFLDMVMERGEDFEECLKALKCVRFDLSLLEDFRFRASKLRHSRAEYYQPLQEILDICSPNLRKFTFKPDRRVYMAHAADGSTTDELVPFLSNMRLLDNIYLELWNGPDSVDDIHGRKAYNPITWISWLLASLPDSSTIKELNVQLHTTCLLSDPVYRPFSMAFIALKHMLSIKCPGLQKISWIVNTLEEESSVSWNLDNRAFSQFSQELIEGMQGCEDIMTVEPDRGPTPYFDKFDFQSSDLYVI